MAGALVASLGSLVRSKKARRPKWTASYPNWVRGQNKTVRILFANVLLSNPDPHGHLLEVANESPDILCLAETDFPEWDDALQALFPDYMHRFRVHPGAAGAAFHIVSRVPIVNIESHEVEGVESRCFVTFDVQVEGLDPIAVYLVHPPAPVTARWTEEWARYLNAVAAQIPEDGALVLLGDFNATMSHGPFRALMRKVKGEIVTQSVATWPQNQYAYPLSGSLVQRVVAKSRWLLPLDHIIVRGVPVWHVQTGQGHGSDHRWVCADLGSAQSLTTEPASRTS